MKIGVEDVSVSYDLPQPASKKKSFRRAQSAAQQCSSGREEISPKRRIQSVAEGNPSKYVDALSSRNENNNNDARPQSGVRFANGEKARKSASSGERINRAPESPIHSRPVTPNAHIRVFGNEPRFVVTSFRQEYQDISPIPTITRVRKELILTDVAVPWNSSCNPPDRDELRVRQDMAKSLRLQKKAKEKNAGVRPRSGSHRYHPKSLPQSYSRARYCKTNGPILNLPLYEIRRDIHPPPRTIHNERWNLQTKDKDDDERAKPSGGLDMSVEAMYHKRNSYHRKDRNVNKGGTISKTDELQHILR